MAVSHRTRRSVRVTVAGALVGLAALTVVAAVVSSTLVDAAALISVLAGGLAVRIVSSEVVQTRRKAAVERADLARAFQDVATQSHREHLELTAVMVDRLSDKDAVVEDLAEMLRVAERRAGDAEIRLRREARRAEEAQDRLAALLDEVLGTAGSYVDTDREGALVDPPNVVNLFRRDDRLHA
jgi:protein phosphatase 1 regulatory subunit 37